MLQLADYNKYRWPCSETADQWIWQERRHKTQLSCSHGNLTLKHSLLTETITGDGDRNELSFIIVRATLCEVRFELFLAQISSSLHNKKTRALYANLRLDLDTAFSNACIVGNWRK